jgi:hexosaminidase
VKSSYSLGLPINFITEPSPNYNSGDLTLVDGQFGSLPWKGNEWIGFNKKEILLELDLLKKIGKSEVSISFLSDENSWIHFPQKVKIVIDNGLELMGKDVKIDENQQVKTITFQLTRKTRKLKFAIETLKSIPVGQPGEGNIPWTFVDEIQVIR